MKSTCVITATELRDAALFLLTSKPAFAGMHPAAVEFEWEPGHENPDLQVRVRVVLFQTAKAAGEYMNGNVEAVDVQPGPDISGEANSGEPNPDEPTNLEGKEHG